jgi:ribosome-binding protein aMBF1 (putative translation factor)
MAKCAVCNKQEEQVQLFDGVYDGRVSKICFHCSQREGIVLIKKPTPEQLAEAQKRHSVRELMEKISSPQKKIMVKDQMIAHKNLAKLKFPGMKQEHGDLVQNYDWVLKQARRHAKFSTAQVSEKIGFKKEQIEALESGQLFSGFERVAYALENLFDIKILKNNEVSAKFVKQNPKIQEEKKEIGSKQRSIIDSVRATMQRHNFLVKNKSLDQIDKEMERDEETSHEVIDLDELRQQKKQERSEKSQRHHELSEDMESGKFDFSRKENLDKIRIQDLTELKKMKQEKERLRQD